MLWVFRIKYIHYGIFSFYNIKKISTKEITIYLYVFQKYNKSQTKEFCYHENNNDNIKNNKTFRFWNILNDIFLFL